MTAHVLSEEEDGYDIAVAVTKGRYVGQLGFIDDWDERGRAIVYLSGRTVMSPATDAPAFIWPKNLRLATPHELQVLASMEVVRRWNLERR